MTQLQFVGHNFVFNRDVFLTVLDQLEGDIQMSSAVGQFACLCVLDGRKIDDSCIRKFCRAVIGLGCAYLSCWGPDCERIQDLMDSEFEGTRPLEAQVGCVMTTWHAEESLEEAVDFFLTSTYPDEDYAPAGCTWGWAIAVGKDRWASELKQQLLAKLDQRG